MLIRVHRVDTVQGGRSVLICRKRIYAETGDTDDVHCMVIRLKDFSNTWGND